MSVSIKVEGLTKRFGNFEAVRDVGFTAAAGSITALLGPSGSGKSTVLRMIAGLEPPTAGRIWLGDIELTAKSVQERAVGFVFQHYALFRHLSVFENVAFGLRVRGWKNGEIRHRVLELLGLVKLESLENRYPSQLSGGQRQRVALARALADLRQWLRRLHDEVPVTTVFVTHDQEEAFEVADRVVVMNAGRIEQAGSPENVF